MRNIAIVMIMFLLIGCGGPMLFARADGGQGSFEPDLSACKLLMNTDPFAQAYARDPLGNMGYPIMARGELQRCMERKGWVRVDAK